MVMKMVGKSAPLMDATPAAGLAALMELLPAASKVEMMVVRWDL